MGTSCIANPSHRAFRYGTLLNVVVKRVILNVTDSFIYKTAAKCCRRWLKLESHNVKVLEKPSQNDFPIRLMCVRQLKVIDDKAI